MAGLTKAFLEGNIVDQVAGLAERLAALERGFVLGDGSFVLAEEATGLLYELVLRVEEGRLRIYARPLEDGVLTLQGEAGQ